MLYLNPKMFEIWLTSSIYKAHSSVMVFFKAKELQEMYSMDTSVGSAIFLYQ